MKTSIIVTTVAALCLMITIAEAPINRDAQINNESLYNNILHKTVSMVNTSTEANIAALSPANLSANTNTNNDFSYLKFNVADYTTTENNAAEVTLNNQFDYLKFNASQYETAGDINLYESVNSTSNEFEYLKFDAGNYETAEDINLYESANSASSEFDYLKFEASQYETSDDANANESVESPSNQFEYLKFDVTKYSSNVSGYGQPVELPVAER